MKIEKINDNQIRCTLTRDDLAQRQLKLSELAYGSEKAKSLFREMMQQAASEFGFESDNLPLMIEAIPTAGDSIVLNITKVDDPDELDTRFSRFTPTPADEAADKHKSVLEHLKKPIEGNQEEYAEESDFLYHLTIQHIFLHDGIKNEIYRENLKALLIHVNSDAQVRSLKPYVIFAVLARKTGMMQKRKHFMPNLNAVLQYQDYQILKDNGKNFNRYQSELELYDHLRRAYAEDADMDFCDFCFANLSPLSEWYYLYCERNEDIPMTIGRKIQTQMPLSFPNLLSDEAYETLDEDEIQACRDAAETLKEKMLSAAAYL